MIEQPRRDPIPPGAHFAAHEQQELDAVVRLLQTLPDPEPSPQLRERIMLEVRRREARPRVLRLASRAARPVAGTALAAGVAGLVVTSWLGWAPATQPELKTPLRPMAARPVDAAERSSAATLAPPAVNFTSLGDTLLRPPQSADVRIRDARSPNRLDQRLDQLLNRLLLDPPAFYEWLSAHENHRFAVARLADRAAARGDASDVALQLRQKAPDHAMTSVFTDELFRATLVDYFSRPKPRR